MLSHVSTPVRSAIVCVKREGALPIPGPQIELVHPPLKALRPVQLEEQTLARPQAAGVPTSATVGGAPGVSEVVSTHQVKTGGGDMARRQTACTIGVSWDQLSAKEMRPSL